MTKLRLSKLAKARIDEQMQRDLEQLTTAYDLEDISVTVRRALRYFIDAHRTALPRRQQLSSR